MKKVLHITSGDIAGEILKKSGVSGEVFVWHDILYDGPREPGWPGENTLNARALFLEEATGGGLVRQEILETLRNQYQKLGSAGEYDELILWYDARKTGGSEKQGGRVYILHKSEKCRHAPIRPG